MFQSDFSGTGLGMHLEGPQWWQMHLLAAFFATLHGAAGG